MKNKNKKVSKIHLRNVKCMYLFCIKPCAAHTYLTSNIILRCCMRVIIDAVLFQSSVVVM